MTQPTALSKVAALLRDTLAAARPDVHWRSAYDTDPAVAMVEQELPAVVISIPRDDMTLSEENGQWRHDATVMFSISSDGGETATIEAVNQDIAAAIVEALHEAGEFDGAIEFLDPISIDATEQDQNNLGDALLSYQAIFYTPIGNIRQIALMGGGLL